MEKYLHVSLKAAHEKFCHISVLKFVFKKLKIVFDFFVHSYQGIHDSFEARVGCGRR